MSFNGFPKDTLKFLTDLSKNNDRDWFNDNKARYEAAFVKPSLEFIAAMEKPLKKISPFLLAVPKKQGGSLMRIYRDVRFSKNKNPYKTNVGIQFRHEAGKDVHAPGLYVHLAPGELFLGAGMWHPDREPLKQIREAIEELGFVPHQRDVFYNLVEPELEKKAIEANQPRPSKDLVQIGS